MPRDDDRDDDRPRRPARQDRYADDEIDDADDPRPARRPARPRDGGGEGFATVVPYRNGPALAAYYCGVFGLIPIVGFVLGPIALILGIIGLVKKKNNPKVHGTGHAIAGIILGIIDVPLWIVLFYLLLKST
jgi:hypothetical protein